jgi:uncharacterized membrane protein
MLIIALIIIGVWYYTTHETGSKQNLVKNETPEMILKKRYVRGEIDEATYRSMLRTLKA